MNFASKRFSIGKIFQKYLLLEFFKTLPISTSLSFLWNLCSRSRKSLTYLHELIENNCLTDDENTVMLRKGKNNLGMLLLNLRKRTVVNFYQIEVTELNQLLKLIKPFKLVKIGFIQFQITYNQIDPEAALEFNKHCEDLKIQNIYFQVHANINFSCLYQPIAMNLRMLELIQYTSNLNQYIIDFEQFKNLIHLKINNLFMYDNMKIPQSLRKLHIYLTNRTDINCKYLFDQAHQLDDLLLYLILYTPNYPLLYVYQNFKGKKYPKNIYLPQFELNLENSTDVKLLQEIMSNCDIHFRIVRFNPSNEQTILQNRSLLQRLKNVTYNFPDDTSKLYYSDHKSIEVNPIGINLHTANCAIEIRCESIIKALLRIYPKINEIVLNLDIKVEVQSCSQSDDQNPLTSVLIQKLFLNQVSSKGFLQLIDFMKGNDISLKIEHLDLCKIESQLLIQICDKFQYSNLSSLKILLDSDVNLEQGNIFEAISKLTNLCELKILSLNNIYDHLDEFITATLPKLRKLKSLYFYLHYTKSFKRTIYYDHLSKLRRFLEAVILDHKSLSTLDFCLTSIHSDTAMFDDLLISILKRRQKKMTVIWHRKIRLFVLLKLKQELPQHEFKFFKVSTRGTSENQLISMHQEEQKKNLDVEISKMMKQFNIY